MTLLTTITLFVIMVVLAAMPSASVALVVTRSATRGFANGAAVALGIVLGDLLFVALAILGMTVLAETMGAFFAILKYAGGAYLIWIGIALLRSRGEVEHRVRDHRSVTLLTSLLSGFVLTLGDVKAILFYASLFPAFVDMASLTIKDIVIIVSVTVATVGGVKLFYAFAAQRIVSRFQKKGSRRIARSTAGCLMIGSGTYLIVKA